MTVGDIIVADHVFDRKERKRRKGKKAPKGLSSIDAPCKGESGVRAYHKINEGQINQIYRLGNYSSKHLPRI